MVPGCDAIDVSATFARLKELGVRVHCIALGGAGRRHQRRRPCQEVPNQPEDPHARQRRKFTPRSSLQELGFKDYDLAQWHGVAIKSGTPKAITDRLNKEMRDILATPELRKLIETIGAENGAGTPEEWGGFYTADIAKWAALMKQLNIKIE